MLQHPNSRVFAFNPHNSDASYRSRAFFPHYLADDDYVDEIDQRIDDDLEQDARFDEDDLLELLPSIGDLNQLRDFVLSTGAYIEQLEEAVGEQSDEFWVMREQAYRIITGLLIDLYAFANPE